jgi:1-acyl-sn-glycerol-3-phosphate acyltransferase
MKKAAKTHGTMPPRSERLFRLFRWYARRYAAKHLHAVRLAKRSPIPVIDGPAVIVMNHPSWWDPILAYVLSELFPGRTHWGVIEAEALRQYRFLGRAGLFGVESGSARGAAKFLQTAQTILVNPQATLWMTGQGRFADVRERPVALRSGAGHLAVHIEHGAIVPVAIELCYWDQRTPEALVAFGRQLQFGEHGGWTAREWTTAMEHSLEQTQDALAIDAMSRDSSRFEVLIQGRAGVGGVYDGWRRLASWLRRERFRAEHH